eukprot:6192387-Pleurochrysis_carterae.AAC.2
MFGRSCSDSGDSTIEAFAFAESEGRAACVLGEHASARALTSQRCERGRARMNPAPASVGLCK